MGNDNNNPNDTWKTWCNEKNSIIIDKIADYEQKDLVQWTYRLFSFLSSSGTYIFWGNYSVTEIFSYGGGLVVEFGSNGGGLIISIRRASWYVGRSKLWAVSSSIMTSSAGSKSTVSMDWTGWRSRTQNTIFLMKLLRIKTADKRMHNSLKSWITILFYNIGIILIK